MTQFLSLCVLLFYVNIHCVMSYGSKGGSIQVRIKTRSQTTVFQNFQVKLPTPGTLGHHQWSGHQGSWAHTMWTDPYLQFNSFMQQPTLLQGQLAPYNHFMQYPQYPMFNQFGKGYGKGKGQGWGMWNTGLQKGQGQDWSKWNSGIIANPVGTPQTGLGTGNWNAGFGQGKGHGWGMWNTGMGKGGLSSGMWNHKRYGQGKSNMGFGIGSQFAYPMGTLQGMNGCWNFQGQNQLLSPGLNGVLGGFAGSGMGLGGFACPEMGLGGFAGSGMGLGGFAGSGMGLGGFAGSGMGKMQNMFWPTQFRTYKK